jgi:hypothetical protein
LSGSFHTHSKSIGAEIRQVASPLLFTTQSEQHKRSILEHCALAGVYCAGDGRFRAFFSTTEAATDAQNSPNRPTSYNSSTAARSGDISARSKQQNGRFSRREKAPKLPRFRRMNEGGDAPDAHLPPHDSVTSNLFSAPYGALRGLPW